MPDRLTLEERGEQLVKKLTLREFETYQHGRQRIAQLVAGEREWYVDDRKVALGVLFKDKVDDDWGYAILGKDPKGVYRWIEGEVSLSTMDDARERLLTNMGRIEASRQIMWKQD